MEMTPLRRSRALHEAGYDVEGLLASAHPWTEWREAILEHDYRE